MQRDSVHSDRSLGELFSDLAREMSTLLRQEVQLAKTEMTRTASQVGKDVAFIAAGAFVAYAGFLALIATLIIVLGTVGLPWWLASLIVTVIVLVIGGVLVMQGLDKLKHRQMVPTQTVQTLKEDQEFIKEQVR
jgi:uncharacterized membrane protein YqjE